jgi:hypothetical protein
VATFTDLTLAGTEGTNYVLRFTAGDLDSIDSDGVTVSVEPSRDTRLTVTVKSIRGDSTACEVSYRLQNGAPEVLHTLYLTAVDQSQFTTDARGSYRNPARSQDRVDRTAWIERDASVPRLEESSSGDVILASTEITVRDRCTG